MNVARLFASALLSVPLLFAVPCSSWASVATPSDAGGSYSDVFDSDPVLASGSEALLEGVEPEGGEESDLSKESEFLANYVENLDDMEDGEVLRNILGEVQLIRDGLGGPGASPSEADYLEDEEALEEDISVLSDDGSLYVSLSLPDRDSVRYTGVFGGTSYILVFPIEYYNQLFVADNGVLYNMGASNITGRFFTSGYFDSADYNYRTFTLLPVFGNSANSVYNYGTLSYMTYYYEYTSGGYDRLTSSTTYGNFIVEDVDLKRSLNVEYKLYYVSVVSLFMLGVLVLCSWKNLRF